MPSSYIAPFPSPLLLSYPRWPSPHQTFSDLNDMPLYDCAPSTAFTHSIRSPAKASSSGCGMRGKRPHLRMVMPGRPGEIDLMELCAWSVSQSVLHQHSRSVAFNLPPDSISREAWTPSPPYRDNLATSRSKRGAHD